MVRVKICGITNRVDAWRALDAGADALGFNFHRPSPRYVTPAAARAIVRSLPPLVAAVGVCVGGTSRDLRALAAGSGVGVLQVHPPFASRLVPALRPFPVIQAVQVRVRADLRGLRGSGAALFLLDAYDPVLSGGTGRRLDPRVLAGARLPAPFLLAGGLTAGNVAAAIRRVRPYGVDVSSGVERAPGRKDPGKMIRFVRAAKCA
ncbi:MAG: phosphoribosylanthranilate isomerase [Candidatus Coatesbacteria bacterium]